MFINWIVIITFKSSITQGYDSNPWNLDVRDALIKSVYCFGVDYYQGIMLLLNL